MLEVSEIRANVHRFVVDSFLFGTGDVSDTLALTSQGVIDSTGVLELIMYVEDTYRIAVADEDIMPENFDSISAIGAYVERKLRASESPEHVQAIRSESARGDA